MSRVVGDVAINVGADTSSLTTGMRGAEASLEKFAKVGAAAVVAVGVAMVALTKQSLANIDALTKQARAIGLTTQAFQKMTMVAGEAGVESGKLADLLGKMQKNFDELRQGTQTQVEAFGRLGVSITDLQDLAPDEQFAKIATALDGIKDPAEKTALAMEVFGKSGRAAINMLSGYSAKAAEAAAFQNRFGIAVSQVAAEDVERANDAVGRLGSVMEGLGNVMATAVAPSIENTANAIIAFAGGVLGAKVTLEEFFGTLKKAQDTLGEDIFNKLMGRPDLIVAGADNLRILVNQFAALEGPITVATAGMYRIQDALERVGESAAGDVMRQYREELEKSATAYQNGEIKAEAFRAKVEELNAKAVELIGSLYAVDDIKFKTLVEQLSSLKSWLDTTASAARGLAAAAGLYGQDTGTGLTSDAPNLMPPGTGSVPRSPRPRQQDVDSQGNFIAAGIQGADAGGAGGGGAGGGIKDAFAQRLEALQEGLATESEMIAEWYLAGQLTLEDALAKKMLTETEYQTLRERLEQEHQDRIAGIREMGNQWGVQAALEGGAAILGAMASTNKRAAKLQGIFAAAAALMSTYQGAAKALEKGAFGFAEAAAIIAKGIGFVSAIKGASSSAQSGGSASAGGGSASAQAPAPVLSPAQANITYYGTPTSSGMQTITDRLNEEFKQGYRVNWDFQPI
jgi:hypothetical protein